MSELRREQFRRAVAILSVTAVIGVLVLLIVYSKVAFDIGVVCPIHEILGLECPGCGGTRMALAIMELDFYQAFRYNPFLFVTLPIWAVIYCWQVVVFIRTNKLWSKLDACLIIYAILLTLFGIIRNFPVFNWLAPTVV